MFMARFTRKLVWISNFNSRNERIFSALNARNDEIGWQVIKNNAVLRLYVAKYFSLVMQCIWLIHNTVRRRACVAANRPRSFVGGEDFVFLPATAAHRYQAKLSRLGYPDSAKGQFMKHDFCSNWPYFNKNRCWYAIISCLIFLFFCILSPILY